jgi:NADP-dependent 3-hydroxy acid dehydrogenase YdfG
MFRSSSARTRSATPLTISAPSWAGSMCTRSRICGEEQGQTVDVSDEQAVATFFSKLATFDHLVFTAGDSLHLHDLAATDLQQARRAFELRYWAVLAAVKYGSPHTRKEGSVVLTTGIAGQRPKKDG